MLYFCVINILKEAYFNRVLFTDEIINADSPDLADMDEVGSHLQREEDNLKLDHMDKMERVEQLLDDSMNTTRNMEKSKIGDKFDPMKIEEHLKSLKMGEQMNKLKIGNRLKNMNMEKQLKLVLGAGRKVAPGAGMLAVEEDYDDEVSDIFL